MKYASRPVWVAYASISLLVFYQIILLLLIWLRPELDSSWHTISEWAIGRYGWLMSTGFVLSGLSYGLLLYFTWPHLRGIAGGTGAVLLGLCTLGAIGVGLFTTDSMQTRLLSTRGLLHIISGSLQLFLLPFAALFINWNLAKNDAWKASRRILLQSAFIPLAGFLFFMGYTVLYVVPLGEYAYGPGVHIGWPPRLALFTYMVWLIILAGQGIRQAKTQRSSGYGGKE